MNTPEPTPAAPWWERVSPDLVEQYVRLAHETRELQRHYRRTLSPRSKNDLPDLEAQFDRLTAELAEALAVERPAELVEGGAA